MILEYTKNNDNYNTVRQVVTGKFNISYNLLLKLKKNNKILLNENFYKLSNTPNILRNFDAEAPAYIMYTSGSTCLTVL